MALHRNYVQMGEKDFTAEDKDRWIAVLPLGAHEQHGPHLPPETDAIIAQALAERLSAHLPDSFPVTFLPVETIGYSPEHLELGNTRTRTYDEAIERWIGIGAALSGKGFRKLVLLNAHGGNSPLMTIVATELRIRHSMLCVATSWTRFGVPEGLVSERELAYGIHGGEVETSVMLAIAPERVHMDKAGCFGSFQQEMAERNRYLRAYGPHAFGWSMRDLNPAGVTGNASAATAHKGELLLSHAVSGLHELLVEVDRFDMRHFGPAT